MSSVLRILSAALEDVCEDLSNGNAGEQRQNKAKF